jgi:hypothetical protein
VQARLQNGAVEADVTANSDAKDAVTLRPAGPLGLISNTAGAQSGYQVIGLKTDKFRQPRCRAGNNPPQA